MRLNAAGVNVTLQMVWWELVSSWPPRQELQSLSSVAVELQIAQGLLHLAASDLPFPYIYQLKVFSNFTFWLLL